MWRGKENGRKSRQGNGERNDGVDYGSRKEGRGQGTGEKEYGSQEVE
jgi:hypothetical protein